MSELYVVGGAWRGSLFKKLEEWHAYKKALIIKLNPQSRTSQTVLEYVSPEDACPSESPSILFKSASIANNKLYACTPTEVLVYQLPGFELLNYVSLPCFNDLHHVSPTPKGNILVADTGLDMVVEVSPQGELLREWSVIGEDTWQRFSRNIDYRKVLETKPHKSHPNCVFQLDDEVWVTRFEQRDAISLTRPGRRIDIGVQRPHDGHVVGDWIYFTTVDGHLVVANRNTLKTEEVVDLNTIDNNENLVLGWCRGVALTEKDKVWVGFTRIRSTRFKENLLWAKHGFEARNKPTHIALYDLSKKQCLDEISLEPYGLAVMFSVHKAEQSPMAENILAESPAVHAALGGAGSSVRSKAKQVAKKFFVTSGALQLAQRLSASGAVILRYHSVHDRPGMYATTIGCDSIHAAPVFERQMELIATRFNPVSMDDVLLFLKSEKPLPPRAVGVTFDDGFKDNFQFAAPILNHFGIPGAFYLLVDSVDRAKAPWYCRLRHIFFASRNRIWRDPSGNVLALTDSRSRNAAFLNLSDVCARSSALVREDLIRDAEIALAPEPFPAESELMMDWDDARNLVKSGHIVGSHTMTHPNVAHVSLDDARRELSDSKRKLEEELGEPVRHFSYPHPALYPQWNETTVRLTEEIGYVAAVTTTSGVVRSDAHPLALPRTYVPREESEFLWNTERTFLFRPRGMITVSRASDSNANTACKGSLSRAYAPPSNCCSH